LSEVYKNSENHSIKSTLVLSWNAAENESFACFGKCAKDKLGIAIKLTLKELKQLLKILLKNLHWRSQVLQQ
jgi:hypothetical protein